MKVYEVNFDGIAGPTHNYSGLSYGNIASKKSQQSVSNPKQAALQGLEKMKFLHDLGIKQAVLPPHDRPHLQTLRQLGFSGSDQKILTQAYKLAPNIFFACCSASSMWAANTATISPSADSLDAYVHITPANLSNKFHREIEVETSTKILQHILKDPNFFKHHPPLPSGNTFADEGAANHTRLCNLKGDIGLQLFVFGRYAYSKSNSQVPSVYPARHTFEASQTIARLHQLKSDNVVYAQQNPKAIDAGVFHNDVISVGHGSLFFYHEDAFLNTDETILMIKDRYESLCNSELHLIKVTSEQVSLNDAVDSYLFNSQIVTGKDGQLHLIVPFECQEVPSVKNFLEHHLKGQKIVAIHYLNLRGSMLNGGGPACLRLRIPLTEKEISAIHAPVFFTEKLYLQLADWINRHYRDRLTPSDLTDINLFTESCKALDELSNLLQLGTIYSFQKYN